jgi:small subunit ribosomal protein S6
MALYDLMLLLDAKAPDERRQAILSEVQSMLDSGGSIVGVHDWGTRRIAYEINHEPEANYQLFQFEGDNALLDRLNHSLRIMDGVIRFRIIRQKPGGPPVPPSPEQPRPQRDEEPTEGRVAARAAADAPPEQGSEETEPAPAPAPAE